MTYTCHNSRFKLYLFKTMIQEDAMQTIEVIKRDERNSLTIKTSVNTFQLGKVMGPVYLRIMDYMKKNGEEPQKAPYTKYEVDEWETTVNMKGLKAFIHLFTKKWNIEMGFEKSTPINGNGEIKTQIIPAGKYLKTLHTGPYQKVGITYKKLYAFAKDKHLNLGNASYEYYLNDPREVPKDKLETEILVPIAQ